MPGHAISKGTFYRWKSKSGGIKAHGATHLRQLEQENARLKKLLAESMLDVAALKDVLKKMVKPAAKKEAGALQAVATFKKGINSPNVEVGNFGGRRMAFVALERADTLAVYRVENDARPQFVQILPTGDAPEGIVAVPRRNLVITANEGDGTLSFFTP